MPGTTPTGTNTENSTMVMAMIGPVTWFIAFLVASAGDRSGSSSMMRSTFSIAASEAPERQQSLGRSLGAVVGEILRLAETRSLLAPPWTSGVATLAFCGMFITLVSQWLVAADDFDLQTEGGEALRAFVMSLHGAHRPR